MLDRYGDFVRYRPPFRFDTLLLWGGPVVLLLIGIALLAMLRRQQARPSAGLSEAEQRRLAEIKARMKKETD